MYSTDLEKTDLQCYKKILNPQARKRKYNLRKIMKTIGMNQEGMWRVSIDTHLGLSRSHKSYE